MEALHSHSSDMETEIQGGKGRTGSSLERFHQDPRPLPPALFLLFSCIKLLIVSESCGDGRKQLKTCHYPLKDRIPPLREKACAHVSFLSLLGMYVSEQVHMRGNVYV